MILSSNLSMNVELADDGYNDEKVTLHFYIHSIVRFIVPSS